jgi:hypothetical protein
MIANSTAHRSVRLALRHRVPGGPGKRKIPSVMANPMPAVSTDVVYDIQTLRQRNPINAVRGSQATVVAVARGIEGVGESAFMICTI